MALEYCREPAVNHMKDSSAAASEKVGKERIDEETHVNKFSPNFPNPFGCDDNPT